MQLRVEDWSDSRHSTMIVVFNPVAGLRRAHLLWRVLDVLVANGVRIELDRKAHV